MHEILLQFLLIIAANAVKQPLKSSRPIRQRQSVRHVVHWDRLLEPELVSNSENKILTVQMGDTIDIICPNRPVRNINRLERRHNKQFPAVDFSVYQFDNYEDWSSCNTQQAISILSCQAFNDQEEKFTMRVQRRTAQLGGLVFKPNSTYFYLSKPTRNLSKPSNNDKTISTSIASDDLPANECDNTLQQHQQLQKQLSQTEQSLLKKRTTSSTILPTMRLQIRVVDLPSRQRLQTSTYSGLVSTASASTTKLFYSTLCLVLTTSVFVI